MIEAGQRLQHRYLIERQIGQGGMGSVYVATDERFGSTVAIKETLCMDDNYRKAIEREAKLLNSLKHSALPRVTDHFVEANGQFLVMEYIPGDDLSVVLDGRSEPFPVKTVLDWADQLLDALEFLHSQESPVIHRDIKPQNLKVSSAGRITLLDFGLAKGNVTGAGTQTNAKSIFGYSRNYASLEQIQGTGTDPRSDLYSLAATLYHLLTLTPPEDALTRAMALLSQQGDPLVSADVLVPAIPSGISVILQKAMDLDPAQRPASAAEMKEMLNDFESFSGVSVATVSVARSAPNDIHTRKTELMDGRTLGNAPLLSSPVTSRTGSVSEVTVARPVAIHGKISSGEGPAAKRSASMGWLTAAAGILIVAGLGTFLMLGYGPFGNTVVNESQVPPVHDEIGSTQNDAATANAVIMDSAGQVSQNNEKSNDAAVEDPQPKDPVTVKKTARSEPSPEKDRIVINGENIDVGGGVKIRNGRVYLPDGRVIDVDKETMRQLREELEARPDTPDVPEVDPPGLTPQQRQKLRILRRKYPTPYVPRSPNIPKNDQ